MCVGGGILLENGFLMERFCNIIETQGILNKHCSNTALCVLILLLTCLEEGPAVAVTVLPLVEVTLLLLEGMGEATTVAAITGLTLLDTGAVTALICFVGVSCVLDRVTWVDVAMTMGEDSVLDEPVVGPGLGAMG